MDSNASKQFQQCVEPNTHSLLELDFTWKGGLWVEKRNSAMSIDIAYTNQVISSVNWSYIEVFELFTFSESLQEILFFGDFCLENLRPLKRLRKVYSLPPALEPKVSRRRKSKREYFESPIVSGAEAGARWYRSFFSMAR
ncbi:unnamed protein product [Blepharisma stoltei]|uniref:Uncharacterized protein n=1 Tax=Blepharisma stoltei TaxID=1481888 RepID=A0AAU9K0K8_9CILI|nr:unnamed protein product [Blepharisma stoltei]